MPTVPRVTPLANAPSPVTPRVPMRLADPSDMGAGVGNALQSAGDRIFDAATRWGENRQRQAAADREEEQRVRQRQAHEEADSAYTEYQTHLAGVLDGRADPATGRAVPGLKARAGQEAAGVARDFAAADRLWHDDPKGRYFNLSPDARRLFDARAAKLYPQLSGLAVDHELAQLQLARQQSREAAYASAETAAQAAHGSDSAEPLAGEAAMRHADALLGNRATLNPDGTRAFADPAAQALWKSASADWLNKYRRADALIYLDRAAALKPDPSADASHAALVSAARARARDLPPELAADVNAAAERADSFRASRLKAAEADARAERLDAVRKAEAAAPAIYQDWIASSDGPPVSAERALSALHEAARQSPEEARPAFTAYMERVNGVIAARERDQQDALKAATDKAEKARLESLKAMNRANVENLVSGYAMIDGRLTRLPEDDIEAMAYALLTDPAEHITSEDHARIAKAVEIRRDARASEFTDAIARDVLPQFDAAYRALPAFSFDADTDTVTTNKANPPAKSRALTPGTPARITRADPVDATGRKQILLADLLEAANATAARLRADPAMTPQQARERFDALTRGTLAEYRGLTLREAVGREAALTDRIRRNAEAYRLTGRRPKQP